MTGGRMLDHLRSRLEEGKSSPGVFLVSQFAPLGPVVEALVMVWAASDSAEWQNQVRHLPSLSRHVFPRSLERSFTSARPPICGTGPAPSRNISCERPLR
jgi:hypothetical protein